MLLTAAVTDTTFKARQRHGEIVYLLIHVSERIIQLLVLTIG